MKAKYGEWLLNNARTMWRAFSEVCERKIVPKFSPQIPLHGHVINVNSRLKIDKNPNENM